MSTARYDTGSRAVNEMIGLEISGTVIPITWFYTLQKTTNSGKKTPYLEAILLLSDIVYWYRPKEKRDEKTGQFLGYGKKFKSDLLQRSYKNFEELFGFQKKSVQRSLDFLEKKNVIKRVFRKVSYNGKTLNNIMFIDLNVSKLKEITYCDVSFSIDEEKDEQNDEQFENAEKSTDELESNHENENTNSENKVEEEKANKEVEKSMNSTGKSTEKSTKTYKSTSYPQKYPQSPSQNTPMDKFDHTLWTDLTTPYGQICPDIYIDYNTLDYITSIHQSIHHRNIDLRKEIYEIEEQIEFDLLKERGNQQKDLSAIMTVMLEVRLSVEDRIKIGKKMMYTEIVKSQFNKLHMIDIQEVIWKLEKERLGIKNLRPWLMTVLYNQSLESGV